MQVSNTPNRARPRALGLVAAGLLVLAGCSGSDFERGALGAGGGALVADAVGGNAASGALIGGAAGVFCDDLTPQVCR